MERERVRNTPLGKRLAAVAACLAAVVWLGGFATPAWGVAVTVRMDEIPENAGDIGEVLAQRAMVKAVLTTTAELLPAPLPGARQGMLEEMLAARAPQFVISYTRQEPEPAEDANATTLDVGLHAFDVQVDSRRLKQWLRQLGLFATAHFKLGYVRDFSGLDAAEVAQLDDLSELMGLEERAVDLPRATVTRQGDGYAGALESASGLAQRQGENLPGLWLALWGEYFAAGRYVADPLLAGGEAAVVAAEAENATVAFAPSPATLRIAGAPSLGNLEQLDRTMRGWGDAARNVVFGDVSFGPQSLAANWRLTVLDPEGVAMKLDEALRDRGMTYSLTIYPQTPPPPPAETNASAEAGNATADNPEAVAPTEPEPIAIQGPRAAPEETDAASPSTEGDPLDEAFQNIREEEAGNTVRQEVDSLARSLAGESDAGAAAPSPDATGPTEGPAPVWNETPERTAPLH